ncbi:MAG: hypothetical protein Q4D60_05735 [Eubacteriales bacterium]|nr:hypothetical protein [Eubacteriales bacterium]
MKSVNRKLMVLAVIILCIGLAGCYYLFVLTPINDMVQEYDITILEERLDIANARRGQLENMKRVIAENSGRTRDLIADYNNLQNEMHELYELMGETLDYQITFDEPTMDANVVRRNIHLNFSVPNYTMARGILEKLQKGKYKCLLKDISFAVEVNRTAGVAGVHANVTVVYYEGISDEAKAAGLASYGGGAAEGTE